jgi:4-amino-4-deoxy-L-arabinose transferase-like glycosyltransferase
MTRAARLAIAMSILAICVRFIGINQPYQDNWSWRQSDVAAIARNYFQGGFHFARPQIDWAGDHPGYVGTEFPILPFLAAICYKIFGVHEWVGRVQSVILFAISLPFFFLLVRNFLGKIGATWALFFYSFAPLGIMASRCFMPDTPSLALSIVGLYFFRRWLESEPDWPLRSTSFALAAVTISLSILIKVTSILIAAPLLCMTFQRFRKPPLRLGAAFRNFKLWLFGAIGLLPAAIWYSYAYWISLKFYPHHFFGAGGVRIMPLEWYLNIVKEIPTSELTPFLFGLGALGLFVARSKAAARPFYWWLAAMILFLIVVGYGNRHPWYRLTLVPVGAVFAGAACEFVAVKIGNRTINAVASIVLIAAFGLSALVYVRSFYRSISGPMRSAGLALKRITPPDSLIVAADNGDPTVLYYAERKGWHFLEKDGIYYGDPDGSEPAIVDLEVLRPKGASYLVFTSNTAWWLDLYSEFRQHVEATSTLIEETSEFKIYRLNRND